MFKIKKRRKFVIIGIGLLLCLLFFVLSNTFLALFFSEKVYTQRANQLETLENTSRIGVELDVNYNLELNSFDIYHPPEKSQKLYLNHYFETGFRNDIYYYWLDFKNLSRENSPLALDRLLNLTDKFGLNTSQIVVESINANALIKFQEKGFRTSYYLPQDLHKQSASALEKTIASIQQVLDQHKPDYVSTRYSDYQLISTYFPAQKKLIWFTVYGEMNRFSAQLLLLKIALDESVDILLLPE